MPSSASILGVMMACSFQKEESVLVHMLTSIQPAPMCS